MKNFIAGVLWALGIAAAIHLTNRFTHIEENLMAIAESTLSFITEEEGKRNRMYRDSKGLPTIGVGHLIRPAEQHLMTATLSDKEVEDLLRSDLRWCSDAVERAIKVPLNQNQFDALYSLCFNIGETNFRQSTVVRKLNAGDYEGAADAILLWNKPEVLKKRRKRERELFLRA